MRWCWRSGRRSNGKLGRQVVWPTAAQSADLLYPITAATQ